MVITTAEIFVNHPMDLKLALCVKLAMDLKRHHLLTNLGLLLESRPLSTPSIVCTGGPVLESWEPELVIVIAKYLKLVVEIDKKE